MDNNAIKLTQYSHGAGCGCKISPQILDSILVSQLDIAPDPKLLVGNSSKDDAAAYDIGGGMAVLSTTDFFMPICDDPFDFGRIAATNAISDIYAMGGKPLMAIAILGWPVNKLAPQVAQQVIEGGRQACKDAGIMLAGGHSIDSPEPIFGLAVTGQVPVAQLKQNTSATTGDYLFLTKPLGVGILTTAQKQGKLNDEHTFLARDSMCQLNDIGADLAKLEQVSAMTDVTGFGLLGHLLELCEGSAVSAQLNINMIPALNAVQEYIAMGCVPGGTQRNFDSYGHKVAPMTSAQQALLCDPQTSGGLLVAVSEQGIAPVQHVFKQNGLALESIGRLVSGPASHCITFYD